MAHALLRVDKYLEGEHMTTGVVVDVRRLDAGQPGGARVARASAPVGETAEPRRLDLPPGRYEFTAILPSGDVLTRVADVDARPEGVRVIFEADRSAHEWMSWQHALGNVPSAGMLVAGRERRAKSAWPATSGVVANWMVAPGSPQGSDPMAGAVGAHLAALRGGGRISFDPPLVPPTALPSTDDPPFQVFRMPPTGTFQYDQASFPRHYLRVGDATGRQMLCALPYPWRRVDAGEATVEALVGPDQPLDADARIEHAGVPWSVSTIVRDDHVASVLSYFAAGDAGAAAFLAGTALDLLFGKTINPMAASAGAYVLVDQWLRDRAERRPAEQWLDWIDNLARWFPWLPDGALLQGWVALVGRDGIPSVDVARRAFVEAVRRGIPLYTAGVRRLEDGLTRIANQDRADGRTDPAVLDGLDRMRALAWNVDPRFPFTTIRLWIEAA